MSETEGQRDEALIESLEGRGWKVIRQGTYLNLRKRIDYLMSAVEWEQRDADGARHWARDCCREERRLTDRLNEVCTAAASLGVPIDAINDALTKADANFKRTEDRLVAVGPAPAGDSGGERG